MEAYIDRNRIARSFHRHAAEYDVHASVQKRIVNRLISLVKNHIDEDPAALLDVGCGTGQLLISLRKHFPLSRMYGLDLANNMTRCASEHLGNAVQFVNADAEHLPFKKGTFDLLVSTSTLQWLDSLDIFFQQARHVIHPNGLMCIAFFGGRTLCELRECFRDVVLQSGDKSSAYAARLHRFMDRPAVEKALSQTDFDRIVIMSEIETEYYDDLHGLLRSIKRIGAGASAQGEGRGGLGWRSILNETSLLYNERYGTNGSIPATYEIIYVIARCGSHV